MFHKRPSSCALDVKMWKIVPPTQKLRRAREPFPSININVIQSGIQSMPSVSTLQPRLHSLGETHLHTHPSPPILPITAEPSVLHTESAASSLGVTHSWPLSHPRLDFIFSITFLIFPSVERRWAGRGSSRDLASDWSAPCDGAQMK